MIYRGTINIDFTSADSNQQNRLTAALLELSWVAVETSAYVRDTDRIDDLWEGIGIVARQAGAIGLLSALTFHIQRAERDFNTSTRDGGTWSKPEAVREIKSRPFPGDP